MNERPIIFSGPMVRALLDGCKTQTRRVCKPAEAEALCEIVGPFNDETGAGWFGNAEGDVKFACPYGQPCDRLWVREAFQPLFADGVEHHGETDWKTGEGYAISYTATDGVKEFIDADNNLSSACKPSIHMPRWASRILLEIVSVRVERLQDISEDDAEAEGCDRAEGFAPKTWATDAFRAIWESIHGPGSWEINPWVWVIKFCAMHPAHE